MNTTDPRSEFCRPLGYDEIQVLIRRGHIERSKYLAASLQRMACALRRWGRHTLRRLAVAPRGHDLSGRPA